MPPQTTVEDSVAEQINLNSGEYVLGKLPRSKMIQLARIILVFCEKLANTTLYKYQRDFGMRLIQSLVLDDGEEITGLFSRQSGKSETLAVVIVGCMVMLPLLAKYIKDPRIQKFRKGLWVGIFAPTRDQSNIIHSRVLARLHSDHARQILMDDEIGIVFDDERLIASVRLPNGSFCDANTAAKQAKIEGKTYHWLILEEAQDLDPYVYKKSISPMGASTNASQVKIGTCNMRRSDFYEACQRNAKRDAAASKGVLQTHFQYDYETACKFNAFYRKYIGKERERLGFDSDEFRLAYRLHWILERGMFVEPTAFEIMGRDYSVVTYDNSNPVVVGLDVGKMDASSVVTIIQPDYDKGQQITPDDYRSYKRVLNWLELKGDDYVLQTRQICDFLRNYHNIIRFIIDSTGVGSVVFDMLTSALAEEIAVKNLEMIPFLANPQTNHDLYHRLLLDLQSFRIEYPNSERSKKLSKQRTFVLQMTNLQKLYKGAFLDAMAGDATPYKDYCSSLALACFGCDSRDSFGAIEVSDNLFYTSRRSHSQVRTPSRDRAIWR